MSKGLDVIIFKRPIEEILDTEKNRSIRSVLTLLDALIPENNTDKINLRKVILDEFNSNFRMFSSILEDIVKRKSEQVEIQAED